MPGSTLREKKRKVGSASEDQKPKSSISIIGSKLDQNTKKRKVEEKVEEESEDIVSEDEDESEEIDEFDVDVETGSDDESSPESQSENESENEAEADNEADNEKSDDEDDENDEQESSQDESDSNSDAEIENINLAGQQKKKKKTKRTDPEAFSTAITAILGSHLKAHDRTNPVLVRSKASARVIEESKLEAKAKRELRIEKKQLLDKERIKDVISGTREGETAAPDAVKLTTEHEKSLKKTAKRGVVKLFNTVLEAQKKAAAAALEQ
ncbi:Rrp15p-domain-containing protein [Lipomyces japonicus]|uniref:Rrp15p-domain-containing protein n=1 Tax=Lipomyces japonicus TaxID=56871 RepID=UPI0034CEB634